MKKNCRKALATFVLVLILTPSAFADDGIIWTGVASPPPPPPPSTSGIIWTGASNMLTEIELNLLQVLTRF
ncbi:MAG: hypothetical protein ACJ74W_08825 [Pyrinomonadaceae bacterium]